MSEIARLQAFVLWFISEPKQELGAPAPWSMKLAGNVIDPPTWCGAATTPLCGGRGDHHPLWRSSLVEPGAKVTVIVFTEETWWPIYYTPHPGHLKLAGVAGHPTHTPKNISKPYKSIKIISLALSTL